MVESHAVEVIRIRSFREARDTTLLAQTDGVLLCCPTLTDPAQIQQSELHLLADALASQRIMGIVLAACKSRGLTDTENAFMHVPADISADELWGRLAALQQFRPHVHRMEQEVSAMQRLGKKLNQHFVEVDQELRLASRLQRDFLPRSLPEVKDIRFAVLYRPASWVSGDIYNVQRLDESCISLFLADAIGHGVAAGLLTMFVKQAIVGKRVQGDRYAIIPPEEVLAPLNNDLAAQELPNCQFITACYAIVDVDRHLLTFSRAGHPHPIHVDARGQCSEVRTVGGLLGIFPGEEFPSVSLSLEPGEKLIIYSDGVEDLLIRRDEREQGRLAFTSVFQEAVRLPATECLNTLRDQLDEQAGSLEQEDDQTCLVVERIRND